MPISARGRRPLDAETLADLTFEVCEKEGAPTEASTAGYSFEWTLDTAAAAVEGLTDALKLCISGMHSRPALIEITGIIKQGGPLTKRISLSPEGRLLSDGSACVMSVGFAWSETFATLAEFGALIDNLPSHKAIALGALRDDLSEPVRVVTKRRLREPNSTSRYDRIARTREYIEYRP